MHLRAFAHLTYTCLFTLTCTTRIAITIKYRVQIISSMVPSYRQCSYRVCPSSQPTHMFISGHVGAFPPVKRHFRMQYRYDIKDKFATPSCKGLWFILAPYHSCLCHKFAFFHYKTQQSTMQLNGRGKQNKTTYILYNVLLKIAITDCAKIEKME
jgi:hypothetical protein